MQRAVLSIGLFLQFSFSFNPAFEDWAKNLSNHPDNLKATAAKAKARASQLGEFLWPDLVVRGVVDPDGMGLLMHQTIPFPGKMVYRSIELKALYQKASQDKAQQEINIYTRFKSHYLDGIFYQKSVDLLKRELELLKQINEQISGQVTTGRVDSRAFLTTQIEELKLEDKLTREKVSLQNIVLSLKEDLAFEATEAEIKKSLMSSSLELPILSMEKIDIEASPMYKASEYQVKKVKAERVSLGMRLLPDFFIESQHRFGTQRMKIEDEERFGLRWEVPITGFSEVGRWKQKKAKLDMALAEKHDVHDQLRSAIEITYNLYDRDKKSFLTHRDVILPSAKQWLEESQSAYVTGRINAVEFLEAFRTLLDLELLTLRFEVAASKALTELERLIGEKSSEWRQP